MVLVVYDRQVNRYIPLHTSQTQIDPIIIVKFKLRPPYPRDLSVRPSHPSYSGSIQPFTHDMQEGSIQVLSQLRRRHDRPTTSCLALGHPAHRISYNIRLLAASPLDHQPHAADKTQIIWSARLADLCRLHSSRMKKGETAADLSREEADHHTRGATRKAPRWELWSPGHTLTLTLALPLA